MLYDLLKANRSYRSFDAARAVSKQELLSMIEAARLCPSAANRQPLRYRLCFTPEEMAKVLPYTRWAGALPTWHFPPIGHEPPACIVICHDTAVSQDVRTSEKDCGIAAQTILLAAAEMGLGGCMIASIQAQPLAQALAIPAHLIPVLAIPIGKPDEEIQLEEIGGEESTVYYRDEAGVHHVPKLSLDALILSPLP